jgi:RNA polymerase sigma-70 factor, ECF subfamily
VTVEGAPEDAADPVRRDPARRARTALERAYREEWAAVLATLTGQVGGDLALAEDAVADAFAAAAAEWPERGVPRRPGGWLTTVARRRAIDRLRREQTRVSHQSALDHLENLVRLDQQLPPGEPDGVDESSVGDDRLRLVFTCCHPALAPEARIALTLRSLGGLEVAHIARAFLTTEATMYQRLVRAKRKITAAGIPYRVPADDQLPERLAGVLRVVYLIYTEGHTATEGDVLVREPLCEEAIRLARVLVEVVPDHAETQGLLALLLLIDARRPARVDGDGSPVALEDQDRSRWDGERIAEGTTILHQALARRDPGPYQVQAAIAALHAEAASTAATDWEQIAALYAELERMDPSPVVTINRAVAVAQARGPEAGLEILAVMDADARVARYQPLHAARAELLRRAGDVQGALAAYRDAVAFTDNAREREALERRMATLAR